MSACRDITNMNFLSPINFQFTLHRAPGITYTVQQINLPGIDLPQADRPTPFVNIPTPGDHLVYEPLQMTFRVNEDMGNWFEIYNWMTALGAPRNFNEYSSANSEPDGTLLVLNSNSRATTEIAFYNMFPVDLGPIDFNASLPDVEYATCSAAFVYSTYKATSI